MGTSLHKTNTEDLLQIMNLIQEEFPLETREEAYLHLCNSIGSPRYPFPLERNTKVHATTEEEPHVTPIQLELRVDSPASSGKESRCFRCTSRGRSHLKTLVHPRESSLNSKRAQCPNPLLISLIPPLSPQVSTRLSPRVSTQNKKGGVTALWHLERKPQIHMSSQQEA